MPGVLHKVSKRTQNPDVFGHIPGIPVGERWESRQACSDAAVHPGILAGIYGRKDTGAFSVALSGGYEDDVDYGYKFTYTGCGGRDTGGDKKVPQLRMGPQVVDQTFEDNPRNMALKVSSMTGKPVRVVRGFKLESDWAPADGYRYDGLYKVIRAWREQGRAGHLVCKYEFVRLPDQPPIPRREGNWKLKLPKNRNAKRRETTPIPEPKFEGIPVAGPSTARSRGPLHPAVGIIRRPLPVSDEDDEDDDVYASETQSDEDTVASASKPHVAHRAQVELPHRVVPAGSATAARREDAPSMGRTRIPDVQARRPMPPGAPVPTSGARQDARESSILQRTPDVPRRPLPASGTSTQTAVRPSVPKPAASTRRPLPLVEIASPPAQTSFPLKRTILLKFKKYPKPSTDGTDGEPSSKRPRVDSNGNARI